VWVTNEPDAPDGVRASRRLIYRYYVAYELITETEEERRKEREAVKAVRQEPSQSEEDTLRR
jgi:hypothetical protein